MSYIDQLMKHLKEACEPMEEKKIITLGDILDLIDEFRTDDQDIVVHSPDETALTGPMCSDLWEALEDRAVDCIGIDDGVNFAIWLEEAEGGGDDDE